MTSEPTTSGLTAEEEIIEALNIEIGNLRDDVTAADTALAAEKDRVARLRGWLEKVCDEFDYWATPPRPAIDGGTVRGYKFSEVQPEMDRAIAEARRVLAETADTAPAEPQPFDEADNMCPNCVTPWICNGPHLSEQTAAAKRAEPQP